MCVAADVSPPAEIPARLVGIRSISNKKENVDRTKMAEVAEQLANILKETPSEATSAKAKALVGELNNYCHQPAKPSEVAKVAEKLATVLREPPSEANSTKVKALYEQLLSYHVKEGAPPLTLTDISIRDFEKRINRMETGLTFITSFVFCIGSIGAGVRFSEKTSANNVEMRVANLEEKTKATDEMMARHGRKINQLDYHVKMQQECPSCKKTRVQQDSSESIAPVPEAATWRKWLFGM